MQTVLTIIAAFLAFALAVGASALAWGAGNDAASFTLGMVAVVMLGAGLTLADRRA